MNVLLASSEVHPYSKTGGLADMVGALGKALSRQGHRVGIVTPLYAGIAERFAGLKLLDDKLQLPLGGVRRIEADVRALELNELLTVYFIDQPEFYFRRALYQEGDADYVDNAERFVFLSKAVVHLAGHLPWQPDLVHLHDWQVGLVPLLLQHEARTRGQGRAVATCMTVHNLAYQGVFPASQFSLTNLPWDYFNAESVEFYGRMNCLKAGIAHADIITTVSPRYAREITTPEFGCGLDGLLRRRRRDLFGILNGVDYDEWNTNQNPFLKHPYSAENLSGKAANKVELQRELGLPENERIPLFGSVGRLVEQKGVDIQLGALEEMLSANMQFVLLGSGGARFEQAYRDLARRYPTKVAVRIGYDQGLSHRIEAACDFFMMPSRFEPCGLNQMYSLRYGAVPIVRITGGLDDTVVDPFEDEARADGIKFGEYSSRAVARAMRKALVLYSTSEWMSHFQLNAIAADFSWERTAHEYVEVYEQARALGSPVEGSTFKVQG